MPQAAAQTASNDKGSTSDSKSPSASKGAVASHRTPACTPVTPSRCLPQTSDPRTYKLFGGPSSPKFVS